MTEIQPIGDYYEVDENGYLINPCEASNIPLHLQSLVRAIGIQYRQYLGGSLLGFYLRGSVPAGKAIPGISDLDVLGLLKWPPKQQYVRWERPSFADDIDAELRSQFKMLTHIDHAIAHHDPTYPGGNDSVKMVLKTQSICILGEDVIPNLPEFKIGPALCIHHKWVRPMLESWEEHQDDWETISEKMEFLRSCTKTIVRSGFELVMANEGRFTQDLYPCYSDFSKHHPTKAKAMRQVLMLFLNPSQMQHQADEIFDSIGPWLIEQIESTLDSDGSITDFGH